MDIFITHRFIKAVLARTNMKFEHDYFRRGEPQDTVEFIFVILFQGDSSYLKTECLCDLDWLSLTPVLDCT